MKLSAQQFAAARNAIRCAKAAHAMIVAYTDTRGMRNPFGDRQLNWEVRRSVQQLEYSMWNDLHVAHEARTKAKILRSVGL